MPQAIEFDAPLVPLELAAIALNLTRKQALAKLAARDLLWAFDVALGSRRDIRVLAQEIARVQGSAASVSDFSAAIRLIFPDAPQPRPGIVAKMSVALIGRRLCIGSDHALRLMRGGWLKTISNTRCQRGPGGSPDVDFFSVVEFLKRRRIA